MRSDTKGEKHLCGFLSGEINFLKSSWMLNDGQICYEFL